VRGRGVPRKDGTHGDLLATIEVVVPANLDETAKSALEAYAAATPGNPRTHLDREVERRG
jgi:molecular chaperone DnaJ